MMYVIFGLVIFWMMFLGTPTEALVIALALFALVCIKLVRILAECEHKN